MLSFSFDLERTTGIEPAFSAWEADVLPMNYVRMIVLYHKFLKKSIE